MSNAEDIVQMAKNSFIISLGGNEKLFTLVYTDWLDGVFRYCMVSKKSDLIGVAEYVIFAQEKDGSGEISSILLNKGTTNSVELKKIWKKFKSELRGAGLVKGMLNTMLVDFENMDSDRAERLFNSIINGEV